MNKAVWALAYLVLGMVCRSPWMCLLAALVYCDYLVDRSKEKMIDDFVREEHKRNEERRNEE